MSEETSTATVELKKGLPPVGDLFNEAWNVFKVKWLKLLIFFLIIMGISMLFFVIFGLLFGGALVLNGGMAGLNGDQDAIKNFITQSSTMISLSIVGLIGIIAFTVFNIASQAGMILLVADEKTDQSAFSYLKKGFPYIIPLLVLGIINFVLMMGGLFALVIPMVIIMIFLGFSMYVAVLENKKAMDAIRMSASMVSQNFWAIVGRMLLFLGLNILVQLMIGRIGESEVMGPLGFILIMVLSVGVSWFGIAYVYSLYNHARASYDESKKASITWMWVIAIIGWILIVLSFSAIMKVGASKDLREAFMEGFNGEMKKEFQSGSDSSTEADNTLESDNEYVKSGSKKFLEANSILSQEEFSQSERDRAILLLTEAIEDFKVATEMEPKSAATWYHLAMAYKHLAPVVEDADKHAISSFEKAIALEPNNAELYIRLAQVYSENENYEQSIKNYQKAIKLEPNTANSHYNLGLVYKEVGAKSEAKKEFENALELLPDDHEDRYMIDIELSAL